MATDPLVVGKYNDRDYATCIADAKAYAVKYPDDFVKVAALILNARQAWIDKLDEPTASPADKTKLPVPKEDADVLPVEAPAGVDTEFKPGGETPGNKE